MYTTINFLFQCLRLIGHSEATVKNGLRVFSTIPAIAHALGTALNANQLIGTINVWLVRNQNINPYSSVPLCYFQYVPLPFRLQMQ
jgi:hypothetical protein